MERFCRARAQRVLALLGSAALCLACGQPGRAAPPAETFVTPNAVQVGAVQPPGINTPGPRAEQSAPPPATPFAWSATYPPDAAAPSVVAEGFSLDDAGGSYAAVVENPLATPVGVRVQARFLTAQGSEDLERTFTLPYIGPHGRSGWADVLPAGLRERPVEMAVTLVPLPPGESSSTAIALSVTAISGATPPVVTVLLINHNAVPVQGARVSVVAFGVEGSVLGGGVRSTPALTPHLDTQLVVPLPGVSKPLRTEAFASFTPETHLGAQP